MNFEVLQRLSKVPSSVSGTGALGKGTLAQVLNGKELNSVSGTNLTTGFWAQVLSDAIFKMLSRGSSWVCLNSWQRNCGITHACHFLSLAVVLLYSYGNWIYANFYWDYAVCITTEKLLHAQSFHCTSFGLIQVFYINILSSSHCFYVPVCPHFWNDDNSFYSIQISLKRSLLITVS